MTERGGGRIQPVFADACRRAGVRQSMSAIGNSADNALAESFQRDVQTRDASGPKALVQ
ncbi:hypothetical protein [Streptomyces sp. C10-9-1]|uniref:hypothetical protein n=1 Tax=Streptomyces sp. C10-9-1 TaxID=1859285 RepID=UPI003D75B73A